MWAKWWSQKQLKIQKCNLIVGKDVAYLLPNQMQSIALKSPKESGRWC